jgi:sarcosine oxidase subunit beta
MVERLECDVAIIGGGTAGCAAAVHLRRAGMTVVLLERDRCGAGASGVNFGGVRQQGRHPAELPLARRSRAIWSSINELLGEDTEFEASGHLKLARSEADMAQLEAYAVTARELGIDLQLIGANAIRDQYPWLGEKVIGGSLCADDGQANPRVVAPAYARLARKLGADVREGVTVTSACRTPTGFDLQTANLSVRSKFLINTAGAGGAKIAAMFDETIPLEPLMPNMVVTEPLPYVATRSIGVCGGDVYLRQIKRGNVIFGGGRGVGDAIEWRSRPKTESTALSGGKMLDIVPGFANAMIIRSWTGIDAETPDDIPVIGFSTSTPGLIHAFGFSGHGFQLGPVMGEVLTELVRDGETPTPLAPFHAGRFTNRDAGTEKLHAAAKSQFSLSS